MTTLQTTQLKSNQLIPTLQRFQVATRELLDQRGLTSRSDWKFVLPTDQIPELLFNMQSTHALLYAGESPIARYHSRYYDSTDLRCYQDHRRGVVRRFKLRHRHYIDRALSMFEVKSKGPRGDTKKQRMEVPFAKIGGTLDSMCREFAERYLNISLADFAPSLDNSFSRITLLGLEAEERITVDLDISFSHHNRRTQIPGLSIVEVKSASPRHLTPTLSLLSNAGLRPQGMSKYCAGITLLDPDLLPSWFASMRRRIESMTQSTLCLVGADNV